ncbi:MAG: hypothetical protein CM15mP119_3380 [Alphaproteobacteria bacterium]|nr:MAG: hypothetical protein CM15mP119_3380 [Alphaproteobacteria bacterium]
MTATVFLHKIDTDLIDTGYKDKLHDFDWRKRAQGVPAFLLVLNRIF